MQLEHGMNTALKCAGVRRLINGLEKTTKKKCVIITADIIQNTESNTDKLKDEDTKKIELIGWPLKGIEQKNTEE